MLRPPPQAASTTARILWACRLSSLSLRILDNQSYPKSVNTSVPACANFQRRMASVTEDTPPEITGSWRVAIIGAAILAFGIKLLLALKTYGTNDIYQYEFFFAWVRYIGVSAYRVVIDLNLAPSVFHVLTAISWAAGVTTLPFSFWLRLPGIVADAGSVWLVCKILRARLAEPAVALAVVFFALSPVAILVSGFHGNTDTVMMFFVLLSIFCAQRHRTAWASGATLGLAMNLKVVPIILIPVFVLYLGSLRRRIQFLTAAGAILILGWSPYVFQDLKAVLGRVFLYKSTPYNWGLSYLLGYTPLSLAYQRFGAWISFALIAVLSYRMSQSPGRRDLFAQAGVVLLLFMALANGFGVQYLAWVAPGWWHWERRRQASFLSQAARSCLLCTTTGLKAFHGISRTVIVWAPGTGESVSFSCFAGCRW
jgi:hypothetical protein